MDKQNRIQSMYDYLRSTGQVHTRKDLAEIVGATPSNVASALRGDHRCLTDSLLRRINRAFGYVFSEKWLMTGEGEMLSEDADIVKDCHTPGEEESIKLRLLEASQSKGLKESRLESELGLSRSYFRNTRSVSALVIARFLTRFPEVSADWILTGNGEMLRQASEVSPTPQPWEEFVGLIAEEVRKRMRNG